MNRFLKMGLIAVALLSSIQAKSRAGFITIMDQIGSTPAPSGSGYWNSQSYPGNSGYNQALIDDFSVSGAPVHLAEVDAEVVPYSGLTNFSTVASWHVAIYSSLAAAENSGTALTGDVFNDFATPAQVTLTSPYGPASTSALVQIPISATLAAGHYYIGVTAQLTNGSSGQIAVYSRYDTGTPGGFDDIQVNPGEAWGYGAAAFRGGNAAYRILATVPEPSSLATVSLATLSFALLRVRRIKAAVVRSRRPA